MHNINLFFKFCFFELKTSKNVQTAVSIYFQINSARA